MLEDRSFQNNVFLMGKKIKKPGEKTKTTISGDSVRNGCEENEDGIDVVSSTGECAARDREASGATARGGGGL